jgi:hypothetical protein
MFMKLYCSETVHCIIAGGEVDEKTFRKWSWIFVDAIAALHFEVVRDYGENNVSKLNQTHPCVLSPF